MDTAGPVFRRRILKRGGSEPQVPIAGNQDAFELTGSLKRPPPVAMTGNPTDFKPPAQRPPETAFPKSDYRYDRDFQPPAPSPPEAALKKGDYRYNRQETTQTGRCSKMVNSGNRRSDMITHDDAETAARNYKDSTEPTFHW